MKSTRTIQTDMQRVPQSLFVFLCCVWCFCSIPGMAQITTFETGVQVTERVPDTSEIVRSFDAVISYDNSGDNETLRFDIDLPSFNITVVELNIYEDRFIRFSWCEETCGWEDLFGETIPRFWCPSTSGGDPITEDGPINGVPTSDLVQHTFGSVTMWCRASDLEPVAALRTGASVDTHYAFEFPVQQQSVPTSVFQPPDFCPVVDSSCFRLDLVIVLDHSGSTILDWWKEVEFILDLVSEFTVSEKAFKVSVVSYAGTFNCPTGLPTTTVISPLTSDKGGLIDSIQGAQNDPPDGSSLFNCVNGTGWFTATVKGVSTAFDQIEDFGRIATKRAVLVITDGSGNRPCEDLVDLSAPSNCSGEQWITAADNAGGGSVCSSRHDEWLCYMYQCRFLDIDALIYAIGVGSVSIQTINRIAANSGTDCTGIGGGGNNLNELQERAILLGGFDALGDVTFDLSKQLLCPSASQAPCEDSCRPGGLCCGGQCICIDDCAATVGDECQTGECVTSSLGTFCTAIGDPCSSSDDQTPAIVGGVFGALFAICCLLAALVGAVLLSVLFIHKAHRDVEAFESAFANDKDVVSSPLFEEKHMDTTNPIYETNA